MSWMTKLVLRRATTQVSETICKLIEKKPIGLFHFANSGYVSRYEMAKFIFDKLSMNVNLVAMQNERLCNTGRQGRLIVDLIARKSKNCSVRKLSHGKLF